MEEQYTLTIIEDMETPLAGTISPEPYTYFILAVVFAVLVAVLFVLSLYVLECSKIRKRIVNLSASVGKERTKQIGWNLRKLKELLVEAEAEAADALLS